MSNKEYFENVAQGWDEMRQNYFSEEARNVTNAMAEVQAGELAADIGAGTGFITEGLIARG
jgi:ubiquinone/menaquinone biosynthesis C-methylase UbiE